MILDNKAVSVETNVEQGTTLGTLQRTSYDYT